MVQLLLENPLLLLFLVAAIGYPLGRVRLHGVSLGVSAVLFAGLAIGSLHADLKLPEIVPNLGLVIFVYTIGLTSGPGFFSSLGRRGLSYNLMTVAILAAAAAMTVILSRLFGLRPALTAGLFAGSLTNTPALAGALEYLRLWASPGSADALLAEPVIGYSLTYPVGVVGVILTIVLVQRLWRVDFAAEARDHPEVGAPRPLYTETVLVTSPAVAGRTVGDLVEERDWEVVFARLRRDGDVSLVNGQTRLEVGDYLSVVGADDQLARVAEALGERSPQRLDFDRSELDYRRMFVSSHELAGRPLRELDLHGRHGAIVTRLRRGDVELVPSGDTVLELGDQVRVLSRRERLDDLRRVFGDSYRALSEIDVLSFSLGAALGLLLGSLPIPLPGGIVFRLGLAGGPLMVGLVLGAWGRTGPVVWSIPYSANLVLRQVGLVLFLAGVGTRSGYAFVTTLSDGAGLTVFAAGVVLTVMTALLTLFVGYQWLKVPLSLLTGMLAGVHTQPAVLGFSLEQTRNELPNLGYAMVYPVAMIAKILLAQLILAFLL